MRSVQESYVKRLRDNYLLILRTLMHDLIVSIDTQGNFVFVNDATVDFWGEPKEKLLGSHFSKYIHPGGIEKIISILQGLIKQRIRSNRGILKQYLNPEMCFEIHVLDN